MNQQMNAAELKIAYIGGGSRDRACNWSYRAVPALVGVFDPTPCPLPCQGRG